jgi:predicted PurR-regulated permease PerM
VVGAFSFIIGLFVVPVWLFFVLRDVEDGRSAFERALPMSVRADVIAMLRIADRVFQSFVRGQLVLGLIVGIMSYVGLTGLQMAGVEGIRFTVLLAVFAGVTEFIPYLGPILGAAPAVAVGFSHSIQTGLFVLLLYFIIQQLENAFLVPYIVGQALDIHPGILIVLMIILSQFGIFWIILAAPLAAITRDLYVYVIGRLSDPPRPAGLLPIKASVPPRRKQRAERKDGDGKPGVATDQQGGQRENAAE